MTAISPVSVEAESRLARLPLLMGVAIGASVPVLLSALGANADGKRSALVYLVASTVGTMACAAIFYIADAIFRFPFMDQIMNPFSLAFVNTVFRLAMLLLLMPFTDVLEALVKLVVPDKPAGEEDPAVRLEERFLPHPALAIEQSRRTIDEMAEKARTALDLALDLVVRYSEEGFAKVKALEDLVDRYEDCLGNYLLRITGQELSEAQNQTISKYLHTLSDFERISDHALNIAQSAAELNEKGIRFSEQGQHELTVLLSALREVLRLTVDSFLADDLDTARRVEPLEEVIDNLCDEMKLHHVDRLQKGTCTISQGFVFNDLVTNCERVSDHCSNVALAMLELDAGTLGAHELLSRIRERHSDTFDTRFEEYRAQFQL